MVVPYSGTFGKEVSTLTVASGRVEKCQKSWKKFKYNYQMDLEPRGTEFSTNINFGGLPNWLPNLQELEKLVTASKSAKVRPKVRNIKHYLLLFKKNIFLATRVLHKGVNMYF